MSMRTDTSYGVVPLRFRQGHFEVFLIHQYSRIGDNTYWAFPKGHPEVDEKPLESAERELREETGLSIERLLFSEPLSIKYTFVYAGETIQKTVQYFVALIIDTVPVLDSDEVRAGNWFTVPAALERVDYQETKALLHQVQERLAVLQGREIN
jgi:bis(5'-nucleosidyl)-tetraphosphatase